MATLLVLYKTPANTKAFDQYYINVHVPLALRLPGLRKYEISKGPLLSLTGDTSIYFVATLTFDSTDAITSALSSTEGQIAAGDVANFATGGADLLVFETQAIVA